MHPARSTMTELLTGLARPRAAPPTKRSSWRRVAGVLVFSGAFAATSWLSDTRLAVPPLPSAFFIPGAILLAALLVEPVRRWPPYLLALLGLEFVSIAWRPGPFWTASIHFALDGGSAVGVALGMRRLGGGVGRLGSLSGMIVFLVLSIISPAVFAFLGALLSQILPSLGHHAQLAAAQGLWTNWPVFFLSNTLAYLTIVPVITWLARAERARPRADLTPARARWRRLEAGVLIAGLLITSVAEFRVPPVMVDSVPALIRGPMLFVLWAAVRSGACGAAAALLVPTVLAIWSTIQGAGAFGTVASAEMVIALQISLLGFAIPVLLLGAIVEERKRAYERLKESEERYTLATRAGRVFVYERDGATGEVLVDPYLPVQLGLTPTQLRTTEDWVGHAHPDDQGRLTARWGAENRGETVTAEEEFRMLGADGTVCWFRIKRAAARTVAAGPRLFGTVADVTDRKAAELAAAAHRRELAHVARIALAGELTASLAHEVNQPVTAVVSNAQAIARMIDGPRLDLGALREAVASVAANARRASDVIRQIHLFVRKQQNRRAELELNEALEEVEHLVHSETILREVELRTALCADPLPVWGDRVQLQQVAVNLLLNALDAVGDAPPGARRIVVLESGWDAPNSVGFTVRDSGPGVPADQRDAIFQPFVTTKAAGLGIGLALSRTIVEAHEGRIELGQDPALGGAAFHVVLPAGCERRANPHRRNS
jgi:PAS domain S-box-containing protein